MAGAIFRIITELGMFVVQEWTGDMAAGVEWSGPSRDHGGVAAVSGHHHGHRSGDAQGGELTQMLVSGGGRVAPARGVDPRGADGGGGARRSDGRSVMAGRGSPQRSGESRCTRGGIYAS